MQARFRLHRLLDLLIDVLGVQRLMLGRWLGDLLLGVLLLMIQWLLLVRGLGVLLLKVLLLEILRLLLEIEVILGVLLHLIQRFLLVRGLRIEGILGVLFLMVLRLLLVRWLGIVGIRRVVLLFKVVGLVVEVLHFGKVLEFGSHLISKSSVAINKVLFDVGVLHVTIDNIVLVVEIELSETFATSDRHLHRIFIHLATWHCNLDLVVVCHLLGVSLRLRVLSNDDTVAELGVVGL